MNNLRYEEVVDNPEPGEESFIPEYLESYGPPNVEGTTLGEIRNELKIYKPYTLGIFRSILNTIDLGENTTNTIVEYINDIANNLNINIKGIDKRIGGYIDYFDVTLDVLDSFSRSIMNLIFSINLALIIAIIISLILIFFFKRGHCLLCCSWSLLYLFLLLTLVIGALFLVVGLFIQNLASGIITFIHNINDLKSVEESDIANR